MLDPSQVRLHPVREDPYRWLVRPGKEYLFEKNLSDQSVGVYKELYDGINKYFEATQPPSSLLNERLDRENLVSALKFARSFKTDLSRIHLVRLPSLSRQGSTSYRCRKITLYKKSIY